MKEIKKVENLRRVHLLRLAAHSVTLYSLFSQEAVSAATDEERLVKIHNVIQQLPPPHYRLELSVAPWWPEAGLFALHN